MKKYVSRMPRVVSGMKIRMKASQVGVSAHGMEVSCVTQTKLVRSADLLSVHIQLTSVSCVSWAWRCLRIVWQT